MKNLLLGALMSYTALSASLAHAQTADAPAPVPAPAADDRAQAPQNDGDIIVTAQKRSERLRDVPLSITAASGDQLAAQGITNPADLERIVPGFTYAKSTFGTPIFTIRGIGLYDTFVGISPTVTVYVDQVPLPYLAMTAGAGLDVERLEVLKGPQGTLFGQNSTGGAINYIAAKPTSVPAAGFDLTYGRFDQVDAQAYVSGPISDTLRARVAVRHEYSGDWQRSETRPDDTLGGRDFTAGRLLLDWEPADTLKFELNVNGWWDKSDTQANQFIGFAASRDLAGNPPGYPESFLAIDAREPAPHNARIADWDEGQALQRDDRMYQLSLRGDYEISDSLTLTSISAYSDYRTHALSDTDGTDFNNFLILVDASIKSFSQELRLAGEFGDRVKYTIGANYQDDKVKNDDIGPSYTSSQSGVGPFRWNSFNDRANQRIKTKAVFANIEFEIVDSLTLQTAARYTDQKRDFNGCLVDTGDGLLAAGIQFAGLIAGGTPSLALNGGCVTLDDSTPAFATLPTVEKELDEDNLSWRAGLNWKITPETLLYANVTKGYKSGSFTPLPAVFASQLNPVKQESVLAYEAGMKTALLDNAVQLSAAGFYYDYSDKQIIGVRNFSIFGNLPALNNIPKTRVIGAEVEMTLRPFDGLRISGGGTYIDSKVTGSFLTPDQFGTIVDIEGQAFPNTPKWQFVADAQYDFPLSDALNGFVGGSVTKRSDTFARFGENADHLIKGYTIVDLRAGFETADGRWKTQIWGRNVFNKYYLTNVAHQMDTVASTTGMPATYGVTLSYRY